MMNCKVVQINCPDTNTVQKKKQYEERLTPQSFLMTNIYEKLPEQKKKKRKIPIDEFQILEYSEYYLLLNNNYTVQQLKEMCKYYKQKVSGNKSQLNFLLFNFLKHSYFSIKIQKSFRGKLIRDFYRIKGPAFLKRKLCINDTDFLSLDSMKSITNNQFFSFKDEDNHIYGFDICSIYNLILQNGNKTQNPYNRKVLSREIIENARNVIRLSKLLNIKLITNVEDDTEILSAKKKQEMRILNIFSKIDELGNYSDAKWFLKLEKPGLVRFIGELFEIWNFRAQLTNQTKCEICPPNGRPFRRNVFVNINNLQAETFENLKKIAITVMENLLLNGVSKDSKCLGAYYILGALTIVDANAAESLPWLYQSFGYNLNIA